MSSRKYDSFKDLRKGKYDWKVQARVMNIWRGYSKTKEPFKSFNLLLVDSKRSRIHAFVPGNIADKFEAFLAVGNVYLIDNFTVKDYRPEDNFRCITKDIQIVFSEQTKIEQLQENDVHIEKYVFDMFDLGELKPLSTQNKYLTDVIGFMESPQPLAKLKNRHGQVQSQIRFKITDGSTSVKVTFWDEFAELFVETLKNDFEYPIIIIIASGRVTQWSNEVDISNVGCTAFYININHHTVTEMRKMLLDPDFKRNNISTQMRCAPKLLTVEQIKQLGQDHILTEVLCQVRIKSIEEVSNWFLPICTSCYKVADLVGTLYTCVDCQRKLPYPEKKFRITITGMDETGTIDIVLEDREVRTLITKTVFNLIDEGCSDQSFPDVLRSLKNKDCTIKLIISKENISNAVSFYVARDIMEGFDLNDYNDAATISHPHPIENFHTQASGSSYHLDAYSELSNKDSGT